MSEASAEVSARGAARDTRARCPEPLAHDALVHGGIGAYRVDLLTGQVTLDDRAARLLGAGSAAQPILAAVVDRWIHHRDRPDVRRAVGAVIKDGSDYESEFRALGDGGRTRWVATRGHVVREGATAVALVGIVFESAPDDVHRAARILESVPSAFFSLSSSWRFSYVNGEAEQLLGLTRDKLLDGDLWQLFPEARGTKFDLYRRAMDTGAPVSFEEYYPAPLDAWYEVRAWPTGDGLSVYFVDITERKAQERRTEEAARRAALTARITSELTQSLDAELSVAALARNLVPELGDWCVVTLADVDDTGEVRGLRDIGWWHVDPERRSAVQAYAGHRMQALTDRSFLFASLRDGDVVQVPSDATRRVQGVLAAGPAHDLLGQLAPESAAVLPLRARGRTLGAVSLFSGAGRPPVSTEDLAVALDIAARAGLALDNAYLYARQRRVAEELQRSFLTEPPRLEHVEVAVRYVAASRAARVGGDWYDAFRLPDGRATVVIGDVAGHDLEAAAAMGQLRSMLRGISVTTPGGPAAALTQVDKAMGTLGQQTSASAVVVTFDPSGPDGHPLRWSSAGHPPPMVLHADGAVTTLRGSDLILGIRPGTGRRERTLVLNPGDTLLLYTDGLIERRAAGGLLSGLARLEQTLADIGGALGVEELSDELLARLVAEQPEDDVAIVVARPGAVAGPERGTAERGIFPRW